MLCHVMTVVATRGSPLEESDARRARPLPTVFLHQPWWVLTVLAAILACSLVLYTWNIGYSGLSTYYAASVRSMIENPRAMFFGALDPRATVTLDKLAGFLIPQALSARIFGFQAWALSLPQAIEGLVTVGASYVIGARWRGPMFGLAVAGVMAFTPMLAAMFGRPMEDGMLTMCMVLSAAAWQRALSGRSVLWLSVAGMWVAVGFQAKMLQAWLILPALLIAYLACAAIPIRRRIWHLVVAGAVTIILSLSWMTAIQLVPADQRPFIDGTTSNNTYSMVFGYNGLDRLVPGIVPGAVPQLNSSPGSGQSGPSKTATASSSTSVGKLVLPQFTTQMGWLYPAALLGAAFEILGLWRRFDRRRRCPTRAGPPDESDGGGMALVFVLWALITGLVMTFAFVPHATYLAVITLPLAALAVSAAARAVAVFRQGGRRWFALPTLVVVQTLWATSIALVAAPQLRMSAVVILALGLPSAAGLVWSHSTSIRGVLFTRTAMVGAVAAALVGPVVWSLCVIGPGGGGSASDAFAGPRMAAPVAHPVNKSITAGPGLHVRPPFSVPQTTGLDAAQERLLRYVNARNGRARITFATDTMAIAVSVILWTDESPTTMGGFSQDAPTPSLSQLKDDIGSGQLRFVLLAKYRAGQSTPNNSVVRAERDWVHSHCVAKFSGRFRQGKTALQTLYDCSAGATLIRAKKSQYRKQ